MDWFVGANSNELVTIVRTESRKIKCNLGDTHFRDAVVDARVIRVIEEVPTYSYWGGDKLDTELHAVDRDNNDWRYHVGHSLGGWVSSTVEGLWITYREHHIDPGFLVNKAHREVEKNVFPAPVAGTLIDAAAKKAADAGYEYFNFNDWVYTVEDGKPGKKLRKYLRP